MKKIFLIILQLSIILPHIVSKQMENKWVDPHDMNSNTNKKQYTKEPSSDQDFIDNKKEDYSCDVNVRENNSLVYLKRVINLLLNSANIETRDSAEHSGHIHFTISNEDFIFLKSFSSIKNIEVEDLRKMDTILSNSLKITYLDRIADIILTTQERVSQLLTSQNCLPLLALSLFLYIAYNLFKANFSAWYVFRYFVLMVILIDFIQRYQQLFQEAEEHNMHLKYSSKCDTSKMSWGEYFKFMTSSEDCEKKVVSLLEVGLNQVRSVIIIPLAAAGTGMGHFGSELWKNLPFPWNILIFPIMLIFCTILVAIIMTTVNNSPFKINLMHLFHLEFGSTKGNNITGKTLEKLLDAVNHRPLLQEVSSAPAPSKTPPKNKNKAVKSKKEKKETKSQQQDHKATHDQKQEDQKITETISDNNETQRANNDKKVSCDEDGPSEGNSG